ncbi:hypothetical protein O181_053903 [Austropuccinia psidii MF-1]|uniref:Uncharacterized protein n=1 Tax=Austropuccinia psidii MF-1 TaxID=1389203 RepID=A0A9Q3E591_9BASI|nr:hypothetical protein [Austropuccinia psidii MF-1]
MSGSRHEKIVQCLPKTQPQTQGNVLDNTLYHQDDNKPDALFENKQIFSSKYQDGDNMTYSEKEELKKLPEASSLPNFSGVREYDNMKLIYYIYLLFIDALSMPYYWTTARLKTELKGNATIWYTEMKKIYGIKDWP